MIRNPCKACHGRGHLQKERKRGVDIPAGVEEGTRIRLAGEGQAGVNGGPPGDLYIGTEVEPHPLFERKGDNIYIKVPITVTEAAMGAKIDVPTLDGATTIRIAPGTQSGQKLRLRGKGTPSLRGNVRGDQFVEVQVVEESAIPAGYWRPQPPKLDRQAVLVALKDGVSVPGAALSSPAPTIAVRTR